MTRLERWMLVEIAYRGNIRVVDLWRFMDLGYRKSLWWGGVNIGSLYGAIERLVDKGYIETELVDGDASRGKTPDGSFRRSRAVRLADAGRELIGEPSSHIDAQRRLTAALRGRVSAQERLIKAQRDHLTACGDALAAKDLLIAALKAKCEMLEGKDA